jgi:hypothetical protein
MTMSNSRIVKQPVYSVTINLQGLDGIEGGARKGYPASTLSRFVTGMKRGFAPTTASDNGSLTAWRDDQGLYRCVMQRYRHTVDEARFSTLKAARDWWERHLPRIEKKGENDV